MDAQDLKRIEFARRAYRDLVGLLRLVSEGEMAIRNADATWHGLVEPLSYGADHRNLPAFLLKHFPGPTPTAAKNKRGPVKAPFSNSEHARLLQDYRAFLLKVCGQMTIVGVRDGHILSREHGTSR
jgi:hypothetical protein